MTNEEKDKTLITPVVKLEMREPRKETVRRNLKHPAPT